ncbi:hypothetical protein CBM2633_U60003 [Cupriavidus taiwanensis]|uniref:Uncharacterized protein n=1 Tax=Cupriavidus taiwanensis TaxID=164546 RepID=A0A976AUQ2_9BURK|nr:hypothetical protein CBM2615_A210004 [Cupriavidus taiwanensis]SOZ53699.1 hypothetical protein CBM2614_A200003 [Cupriavidus taiwanensis]SOZ56118.1 hypothetical protein CBM2613_A210004 [Cupriavidus taiwanensis]SPA04514.1 hypothetical protein CBM2625_A160004 [Cupriavidus taiwanensis]SPA23861.1 hypothetical protein CBM2633_U60003 [Cupriavidus taiwanensis]
MPRAARTALVTDVLGANIHGFKIPRAVDVACARHEAKGGQQTFAPATGIRSDDRRGIAWPYLRLPCSWRWFCPENITQNRACHRGEIGAHNIASPDVRCLAFGTVSRYSLHLSEWRCEGKGGRLSG